MSIYPGNWPTDAVGNFVVRRVYTFSDTILNTVSMRSSEWFGAAWNINDAERLNAAQARGVLKRVTCRLASGTGVAFFKSSTPDTNYNTISASNPIIQLDYRNEWPRDIREYELFLLALDGTEAVEFEIWFDIEEEPVTEKAGGK